MLVAIAIFASLALMAQQVTNGVTRVNSAVAGHDQKLNLMQQTMSFLTHDLTQIMPRPVRGDQGQREPALLAGAGVLASESEGMRCVRGVEKQNSITTTSDFTGAFNQAKTREEFMNLIRHTS